MIDWKILYERTINHDFGEVFIGDIKTPVKHASPELRKMINEVEEKMVANFIESEIPEEFREVFAGRMKEGKDGTTEGLLLELADKLDQLYESFAELKRGNTDQEFVSMYQNALKRILEIPLTESVKYFKEVILMDMIGEETTIDVRALTEKVLETA